MFWASRPEDHKTTDRFKLYSTSRKACKLIYVLYIHISHRHYPNAFFIQGFRYSSCGSYHIAVAHLVSRIDTFSMPSVLVMCKSPDSNVPGADMGPTWGRQDPGGPNVGPLNLATSVATTVNCPHLTTYGYNREQHSRCPVMSVEIYRKSVINHFDQLTACTDHSIVPCREANKYIRGLIKPKEEPLKQEISRFIELTIVSIITLLSLAAGNFVFMYEITACIMYLVSETRCCTSVPWSAKHK